MDPALWELLRAEAGTDGERALEAIIRFAKPGIEIPGVRIVSRFGTIATCRIRARDVIPVRARPDVISVKAPRLLSAGFDPAFAAPDLASAALPTVGTTDMRRSPTLDLTGAGVVVASVDWGVDLDSAALRWPDDPATAGAHQAGATRFLSFWDQRDQALGPRPEPYGYGAVHDREEIDRALRSLRPYERLGYHPGIADPKGTGSHGHHVLDIAAGNGQAGGPVGIAPDADLIFVHLADRNTGGLANFGDSVRLLEAVDFISRTAGPQPCVINISAGRVCGSKDGTALVERALDELLAARPGRFVVNSAGNYFRWRTHSCGTLAPGEAYSLTFVVDPRDITLNELEIWYDGADEFAVRIDPPGYTGGRPVRLGERSDLLVDGRVIGRVYHRKHDPNNGDNHIVAYLDPVGLAGNWRVILEGQRVSSGRFHAWIERDDSCPGCQARFTRDDSNTMTTIGTITTSHLPLIVGAYDGHDPEWPAAPFTSGGPSRDYRSKPDLAAPGVGVLAARSAPIGASRNPGLLVRKSGTSMATPHVTGAVALCFEAAGNRLGAQEIRSLVLDSCDPLAASALESRLGRGYLDIPQLMADLQQILAAPQTAPIAKESTMDATDSTMLLAAAPAAAYREFLYRPDGELARWIADRFDVVARPGELIGQAVQAGDVLLEVALGRLRPGRCITFDAHDVDVAVSLPRLAPGQLLLRPRRQVEVSEPLPVEPVFPAPVEPVVEPIPAGEVAEAVQEGGVAEVLVAAMAPPTAMPRSAVEFLGRPELLRRVTILEYAAPGGASAEAGSRLSGAGLEGWMAQPAAAEESGAAGWRPWQDLILHQVPRTVVADLAPRGISIPKLSDAYGDINLDYYSVRISKLPSLHGKQMTPEALLDHIRRNIDDFVDTNNSSFPPLDASVDRPRLLSGNPLGAVIDIHVNVLRVLKPRRSYIDQSLVVCSRAESRLWVFTTAHSQSAGYHPVTGNRMWGIREEENGWVLFTRGADRATQLIDWVENVIGSLWVGADALWRSFQTKVKDFINANYGSAAVVKPVSNRWPWATISSQLPSAPAEGLPARAEGLPGGQELYPLLSVQEQDVLEHLDAAEGAEGDQAILEWEDLAMVTGSDGRPHVYYVDSGPPGGTRDSLFRLRVRNTNTDRRFTEPYFLVRFRHRQNNVDVPVTWGEPSKVETGNWKRIRSDEVPAGGSHLITINMSPATRRSAYAPNNPLTWVDVIYRWREGATHFARKHSLAFFLVGRSNLMFTQGQKLADQLPLNDPRRHRRFWAFVFGQTFGPSDNAPIKVGLTVTTNVDAASSKAVTLSGNVSRTASETQKVGVENEFKSEITAGIDEIIKLGVGSSTKTSTSFEWTVSNTASYTEALTRSSTYSQGWGTAKSVSGEIAAPPGGGRRSAYLYPVLSQWVLPVIEYRKPNDLGQATERVVVPDVPIAVPAGWELIGDPPV